MVKINRFSSVERAPTNDGSRLFAFTRNRKRYASGILPKRGVRSKRKFRKNKERTQQKIHSFSTGRFSATDTNRSRGPRVIMGLSAPSVKVQSAQFPQENFQQGLPSHWFSSKPIGQGTGTGPKPRLIQAEIETFNGASAAGGFVHIDEHGVHLHVTLSDDETRGHRVEKPLQHAFLLHPDH